MTFKRPFDDEILSDTFFKHRRLVETNDHVSSFYLDQVDLMDDVQKHFHSGDGFTTKSELDASESPALGRFAKFRGFSEEETANDSPRLLSFSPWATRTASESEHISPPVMHSPSGPEYFSFDHPERAFVRFEEDCNLLDYSPRKWVPIGRGHQAVIPDLLPSREGYCQDRENIHLSGQCVIPFSESELCADDEEKVGHGRSDCSCQDRGSIRCVWQRIEEARQKLRSSVGSRVFSELGFLDMGEVVSERWTEDDEHLFHEVVYSNPASFGKNFWKVLSSVFPSRTKMEVVSYYFNVFVLRKRAEQNRFDPLNIDSDEDEWQGSEGAHGDANYGLMDKDEDSTAESPVSHDSSLCFESRLPEPDEHVDGVCDGEEADSELVFWENLTGIADHLGSISSDECREIDGQEGCCTFSGSSWPSEASQENSHKCDRWEDFGLAPPCDYAYLDCFKSDVDLQSTCSMIEEFFGDGDFDWRSKR
ncbi:AT-rich interactive domain-containing protein [Drosera capensis]